jgi:ribosome recycling factor
VLLGRVNMENEKAQLELINLEEKMKKAIENLKHNLVLIRTGRPDPAILNKVKIDYYSVQTPLSQVANISIQEGTQLYLKPYDKSILKEIEHAIHASDLGLNPLNDGVGIRLIIPQPTEERRKELVKQVEKTGENSKVAIRNIRREINDKMKKLDLTEDDKKGYHNDVQDITDKNINLINKIIKEKSQDLLKI